MLFLSMTTRPERVISSYFKKVYYSLKNQTHMFNYLIINLSINDFAYPHIPQYLLNDPQIIINKTIIKGPCTKLIGSIDIIPNGSIVIVLDDDILVKRNFISSLYSSYLKNPTKVSSSFVDSSLFFQQVAGYGGFILRMTNTIRQLKTYYSIMPDCARFIDDTWFGWCFQKMGIDVVKGIMNDPWNQILDMNTSAREHPKWHELVKHTPREKLTKQFVSLCTIYIGSSTTNTKTIHINPQNIIKLNRHLVRNIKLYFENKGDCTFEYFIQNYVLTIIRTDTNANTDAGWPQQLIAYV